MVVTEFGISMEVNEVQLSKAAEPIDIRVFGKVTEESPLQNLKAFPSMVVTGPGIITEVRSWQFWKALFPIRMTE